MFDNNIRPQQATDHSWPEFTNNDYTMTDEELNNYSLH